MAAEPLALFLRAIGTFYIFAGIVALRAMAMDRLMDAMLAALAGGAPSVKNSVRFFLLGGGAVLTFAGGAALALLHWLALPLMLLNALMQAVWLIYAQKHFPPEDADEARGRARTRHAFLIYLVATALVLAAWHGRTVIFYSSHLSAGGVACAGLAASVWLFVKSRLAQGPVAAAGHDDLSAAPASEAEPSRSLCLAPFPGDWPIFDYETGVRYSPERLRLPQSLVERIAAFEEATLAVTDVDHVDGPMVTDMAAYERLAKEAEAIVTAMEEFFEPGVRIEDQTCSISWRLPGH